MASNRLLAGLYFVALGLVLYLPVFLSHNAACAAPSPGALSLFAGLCQMTKGASIVEYVGWFYLLGGAVLAMSEVLRRRWVHVAS